MRKYFLPTLCLLCFACSIRQDGVTSRDGVQRWSLPSGVRIERNRASVRYQGELTEDGLAILRKLSRHSRVTTLTVDSAGGEIVVGMDFGIWVDELGLDVVVDKACLSSCANYVFTAGRSKTIRNGAVVAWHGSAKQPGLLDELHAAVELEARGKKLAPDREAQLIERNRQANVDYMTNAMLKQEAFFRRIGVDEFVTRIGNEEYGVRGFYYLSVEDMARFGISNVAAPEDYPRMDRRALARSAGFPITYLRLAE
ncbi:MAG: hypothetical protein ACREUQ_13780 [Burkholderiales bacterium]